MIDLLWYSCASHQEGVLFGSLAKLGVRYEAMNGPEGKGTILIVDDEPAVLNVTAAQVDSLGYEALTATTAEEAMDKLAEHSNNIRAVLTDNVWRGTQDQPLPIQVKDLCPQLPVVVLSGYGDEHDLPDEVDWTLSKPLERGKLGAVLQMVTTKMR